MNLYTYCMLTYKTHAYSLDKNLTKVYNLTYIGLFRMYFEYFGDISQVRR